MSKDTDKLMLGGCEFKVVRLGQFAEYLIRGQRYERLANEDFKDFRLKTLIEVHRYFPGKPPELMGYLKEASIFPVFISAYDRSCRSDRAVFYGESGLNFANDYLTSLTSYNLAVSVKQLIYWEFLTAGDL